MSIDSHAALDRREGRLLEKLKDMGDRTDQALADAIAALLEQDEALAQSVVDGDLHIDAACQEVEEWVFGSVVRFQPVAMDLRQLLSDSAVALELERIADYAVGMAKLLLLDQAQLPDDMRSDIERLAERCRSMVGRSLDAYMTASEGDARLAADEDREVDRAELGLRLKSRTRLLQGGDVAVSSANAMVVAHILERAGDRATNIAERAVFHASGDRVDLNPR